MERLACQLTRRANFGLGHRKQRAEPDDTAASRDRLPAAEPGPVRAVRGEIHGPGAADRFLQAAPLPSADQRVPGKTSWRAPSGAVYDWTASGWVERQ